MKFNNLLFVKVFIAFSLLHISFSSPAIYGIDGNSMLNVAISIAKDKTISVDCGSGSKLGRNEKCYSKYYPLLSFISVPIVYTGLIISKHINMNQKYLSAVFVLVLQSLISALTASILFLITLSLYNSKSIAILLSFSYSICSYAFVYSRSFFADPLVALLGVALIYFGFCRKRSNKNYILLGLLSGLAVLAKPTAIIFGPALFLYFIFNREGLFKAMIPPAGTIIGLIVYGIYNYARFNNFFDFGHPSDFSVQNFHINFLGNIFSPGRGIIFYAPPVILSLYMMYKRFSNLKCEVLVIIFISLYYLFLHSFWIHWHGGNSWGPRLLLPIIPLFYIFIDLKHIKIKRIFILMTIIGFIISMPNLYSYYERYNAELVDKKLKAEWDYAWSFKNSLLTNIWGTSYRQVNDALNTDVVNLVKNAGEPANKTSESEILKIIPIWWWMLPVVGINRLIGIFGALVMVYIGFFILYKTSKE